jgi:RNA polymerase sigma-70 factor (ECF subfamily)
MTRPAKVAAAPASGWAPPRDATKAGPGASSLTEDDVALSRALVSGDVRAFEVLIERQSAQVFRACYRVLGRVDEAEEAVQEAFVLAYRSLGTFRGDGHPAAWLMRIATREAWRRSTARARQRAISTPLDEAAFSLPSPRPDPSQWLMRNEDQQLVRIAVSRLPEPYREVITLRYFGELSLGEIGAATRRPLGTVKAQVHRGLERLRALIEDDGR